MIIQDWKVIMRAKCLSNVVVYVVSDLHGIGGVISYPLTTLSGEWKLLGLSSCNSGWVCDQELSSVSFWEH